MEKSDIGEGVSFDHDARTAIIGDGAAIFSVDFPHVFIRYEAHDRLSKLILVSIAID